MPVILATKEVEIRKIVVQHQLRWWFTRYSGSPYLENTQTKK
jgi:CRISPR/Cas system CMR-associated protein Cmr1 (group 7 of RAMP superfamily)